MNTMKASEKIKKFMSENPDVQFDVSIIKDFEWLESLQRTKDTCNKCGGVGKESKSLLNDMVYSDDFGNDAGERGTTGSRSGKAKMVDCLKCSSCGHSWIPQRTKEPTDEDAWRYSTNNVTLTKEEDEIPNKLFCKKNGFIEGFKYCKNTYGPQSINKESIRLAYNAGRDFQMEQCPCYECDPMKGMTFVDYYNSLNQKLKK